MPHAPTDPITLPGMLDSHDLADRVQREADAACAMPWWFWEAAAAVLIITLALSAAFPLGVAP
ncbi:MAG: hypothetical protein RL375_2974 [Pseudomonadota bacterium]|jgi:hypothetical protein